MAVRYSANLTMLFTEAPFIARFGAASAANFEYVEFAFPYEHDPFLLREELEKHGLGLVLFNLPPGDWAAGDRGLLTDPARRDEFRRALDLGLEYCRTLGCTCLHAMVGNQPPGLSREAARDSIVENLQRAAPDAADAGVTLLIEALNPFDFPRFFLTRSADAFAILEDVNRPNVKFQFDCYHLQITEGNLTHTFMERVAEIGHVQIADVPGRHQPGTGEINYAFVMRIIGESGYDGFVGLEYRPLGSTIDSLAWLPRGARGDMH
jgi:hydroxypyruvate isomerase